MMKKMKGQIKILGNENSLILPRLNILNFFNPICVYCFDMKNFFDLNYYYNYYFYLYYDCSHSML